MGRSGKGAGPDHRVAHQRRQDGTNSTAVPLPTGGDVQGNRKHGRCRELLVLGPEIAGTKKHIDIRSCQQSPILNAAVSTGGAYPPMCTMVRDAGTKSGSP